MTKRVRLSLLPMLAVVSVMIVPAHAAGAQWFVNAVALGANENIAPAPDMPLEKFTITAGGRLVGIECQKLEMNTGRLVPTATATAKSLVFIECGTIRGSVCTFEGTRIETKPVTLQSLTLEGIRAVNGVIQPETNTFAIIEFGGTECSLSGLQTITGKTAFKMPKGQEESVRQEFVFNTATEVKVAGMLATFKGKGEYRVEKTLAPWSFH